MLRRLFTRSRFDERAHDLYDAVVGQARRPAFYAKLGVPDSLDGRFELVLLHALLAMRRLRRCGAEGELRAQQLFDLMFADFDGALRQLGVGDLKVGPRIRKMAQAFYGRARAYSEAIDAGGGETLARNLRRNLYGTLDPSEGVAAAMAAYVMDQERHLGALDDADLLAGRVSFRAPPDGTLP